ALKAREHGFELGDRVPRAGGQRGDRDVAADRGQAGVDQVAAAVGDAPRDREQRRLRMRRVGVDQQVVLVRRGACSRVWIGQGGGRGERVVNGGPAGPGCWRQHTCPRFRAASKIVGTITAAFSRSSARAERAAPEQQRPADPSLRLSGSITALATPFTAAGELDLDAWRGLLQAQRRAGTQAVVVAGSTGEAAALFNTEYDALLRAAVEELGGHLPVVAGTGL